MGSNEEKERQREGGRNGGRDRQMTFQGTGAKTEAHNKLKQIDTKTRATRGPTPT